MTETAERGAPTSAPPLETWAVVELMAHVRVAGRLSEESHFGVALGRLDVPMHDGTFTTQFFGGSSVYRITPCSEQLAREIAKASTGTPINPWSLRHLLPKPETAGDTHERGDFDDPDDEDEGDGPF